MTNEQRNSLFMESYFDSYFTEKKTKEEYSMDKFKKKYKFIPDKTDGGNDPRRGTIDPGNGHRIKVDFGKNKSFTIKGYTDENGKPFKVPRTIHIDTFSGESKVILTTQYFDRVKNQKRRDGLLQHEVAHNDLHFPSERMANNSTPKIIRNITKDLLIANDYDMNDPEVQKMYKSTCDELIKANKNKPTIKNVELRKQIFQKLKSYPGVKGSNHALAHEYEADLSAATKSGAGNVKKGTYDITKHEHKNINKFLRRHKGYSKKDADDYVNDLKQKEHEETRIRNRNLNDKELISKARKTY